MRILNLISRNFGKTSRTRLPAEVVPCPDGYRGTLQHVSSLCTGCQACAYVCSPSAITFDTSDRASIVWQYSAERCSYCGRCVEYCPTKAISFMAEPPVVTGDRSLHRLVDKIFYQPCARCGRPIMPMPEPVLTQMYQDLLPKEIKVLNRLCEECRSRKAGERIKEGLTGMKTEAKA
jgi:formate hydrogenlyase subunit 6/NADH:ubiquinone oxidoreductase subunit I